MRDARTLALALLVLLTPACTLDSFLFNPRRVDAYRWDEADGNLAGELSDPHPSIVPASDRVEGFFSIAEGGPAEIPAYDDAIVAFIDGL